MDGLRALAVSLVLLFHAKIAVPGGYIGVDLFFVVSGYLLTGLIAAHVDERKFSLVEFYARRIRRIFPALAMVLLAICGCSFLMLPAETERTGVAVLAAATSVSNVLFWRQSGYFDEFSQANPVLHTWSLGVEEQFYLVLPLLIMGATLLGRAARFWIIVAMAALSFALCVMLSRTHASAAFFLTPARAWELLLGSMLALAPKERRRDGWRNNVMATAGLLLIVTGAMGYDEATNFPSWAALVPCVGCGLLLRAGEGGSRINQLLATAPFRFLGKISYSAYLWHWPIFVFARYLKNGDLTLAESLLVLAATLLAAWLSWRYVEQPFRATSRRNPLFAKPFLLGALALTAPAAFGLVLVSANGFPARAGADTIAMEEAVSDRETANLRCLDLAASAIAAGDVCKVGKVAVQPSWLIWGDSHAWAFQHSISRVLGDEHVGGLLVSQRGCPPLVGTWRLGFEVDCHGSSEAVMELVSRSGVTDVLLISLWRYWDASLADETTLLTSSDEAKRVLSRAITGTIDELRKRGVRIWIVDPLPGARANVPYTLAKSLFLKRPNDLEYSFAEYQDINALTLAAFDRERPRLAGRISLQRDLCASGHCIVERGGRPIYFDGNHPAASGSDYFAGLLRKQFVPQMRATLGFVCGEVEQCIATR